jgi:Tol biopolymer transport system component
MQNHNFPIKYFSALLILCLVTSCTPQTPEQETPFPVLTASVTSAPPSLILETESIKPVELPTPTVTATSTQEVLPILEIITDENESYIFIEESSGAIYFIDMAAGQTKNLLPEERRPQLLSIRKNSGEVLVKLQNKSIVGLDLDGNVLTEYLPPDWHQGLDPIFSETLSPDGSYLAYKVGTGYTNHISYENQHIEILNIAQQTTTQLTEHGGHCGLAWSPDGAMLAFTNSNENNVNQIFILNTSTMEKTLLSSNIKSNKPTRPLYWSPDSKKLAYPVYDAANEIMQMEIIGVEEEENTARLLPLSFHNILDAWWVDNDVLLIQAHLLDADGEPDEIAVLWVNTNNDTVLQELRASETPDSDIQTIRPINSSLIGMFSYAHYFTYDVQNDILTQQFERFYDIKEWFISPPQYEYEKEKQENALYITEMFTTNGGCQLPCWWGIMPGKTKVIDALNILNQMDPKRCVSKNGWVYSLFIAPLNISSIKQLEVDIYHEYEIVQEIKVYGFDWPGYGLSQVLTTYGEPDEILLHSYKSEPVSYPSFRLVLIYSAKGFVVYYGTGEYTAKYEGEDNIGCLGQAPKLHLYTPNKELTQDELYGDVFGFYLPNLIEGDIVRPVEEATGLSKHEFYTYYKEESNEACIRTPKDIWVDG